MALTGRAARATRRSQHALSQFQVSGLDADLDVAIRMLGRSIKAIRSVDSPVAIKQRHACSVLLHRRFSSHRDVADLKRAIALLQEAVGDHGPEPMYSPLFGALGRLMLSRYWIEWDPTDVDRAVELQKQAITAAGPDDRARALPLFHLGNALYTRYVRDNIQSDLDQAIALYDSAGASSARPAQLCSHAWALYTRYGRDFREADLDRAMSLFDQAAAGEASPGTAEARAEAATGRAAVLRYRYERSTLEDDLEQCIASFRAAIAGSAPTDPELTDRRSRLAGALRLRFERQHDIADINESVELFEQALADTHPGATMRPGRTIGYARALALRHTVSGAEADLSEALRLSALSIEQTAAGDFERARRLADRGAILLIAFRGSDDAAGLAAAREAFRESVTLSHPDDPDLPARRAGAEQGEAR